MVGLTMQRPLLCASSRPAETTEGASEEEEEEGTQAQDTAKPPVQNQFQHDKSLLDAKESVFSAPLFALQRVLLVMASQCVGTQRPPFLSVALGDHMHSIEA